MKLSRTENVIRSSRFPKSLFFTILAGLLIMGGLHFALMWGMIEAHFPSVLIVHIILAYWSGVAALLTLYVRKIFKRAYEEPMHKLADAAAKIAEGDFSVRVDLQGKPDKLDYLDVMISNFNKMTEELSSIETLRVDFFSNVSHEIKTPIAVIQNSSELLKRNDLPEEKRQEYICTINDAAKRLNTLITKIVAAPDDYYFHIGMKSTDNATHWLYLFGVTPGCDVVVGPVDFNDNGTIHPAKYDYTRNGAWQGIDVPMSSMSAALSGVTIADKGVNLLSFLSGGTTGVQLNIDACYFYKK